MKKRPIFGPVLRELAARAGHAYRSRRTGDYVPSARVVNAFSHRFSEAPSRGHRADRRPAAVAASRPA